MNQIMNDVTNHKGLRLALGAVLVLLALFLAAQAWQTAFGRHQGDPLNTITVQGTGRSSATPDIAKITFTVTESAATVADAQKAATDKTDAALHAVAGLGIDMKDMKTLSYSVSPKYQYPQPCAPGFACPMVVTGSQKIVGYDVSQTVQVTVHDTSKAGDVLQQLGTLGVQNVSGPDFMVDDDNGVKNEARAEAIKQAEDKAKELAKELGVSLGKVVSYSENGGSPYPIYAMDSYAGAKAAAAPSLPTGQNETNVTVNVTYEIR